MGLTQTAEAKGFTILEVMIVLVIAGTILLMVFLAVPALGRNKRNTIRRNNLSYVYSQMEAFKGNTGNYPGDGSFGTTDDRCNFIQNYLATAGNPVTCTNDSSKACMFANVGTYDICFHSRDSNHYYIGPEDEISLQLGHLCNLSGSYPNYPINTPPGSVTDGDRHRYVAWTVLESAPIACSDNQYY